MLKLIKLCLSVIFLFVNANQAFADAGGSICLSPMPGDKSYAGPSMTMGESYIGPGETLSIHIGEKIMYISPASGGKITKLSTDHKHLVQIRRNNKTVVSFWFDFKNEATSNLCLWYYPGYGSFSLLNANDGRCKCSTL